jgi:hypothetical protein
MFFKDGIRRIDYVLAWETNDDDDKKNAKHKADECKNRNNF